MSDEVFRIIVAAGVGLLSLAFIAITAIMVALYRAARKTQDRLDALSASINPVLAKVVPVVDQITPMMARVGPILDRTGQVIDLVGQHIVPVAQKVGEAADDVRATAATANSIMQETRPRVAEVSADVAGIARTGREQAERVGELLDDVTGRAHKRVAQIDQSVQHTVEQVGQVGDMMKRAVMKPAREVNGLAAGVSAAVSSLVKGRKASVDSATIDEEMFI